MAKLIKSLTTAVFLSAGMSTAYANNDVQVWSFASEPTKGRCSAKPSTLTVQNNKISGTITSNAVGKVRVSGRVKDNGTFSGVMAGGLARFSGKFKGGSGSGTWQDLSGCRGTMTVKRIK